MRRVVSEEEIDCIVREVEEFTARMNLNASGSRRRTTLSISNFVYGVKNQLADQSDLVASSRTRTTRR